MLVMIARFICLTFTSLKMKCKDKLIQITPYNFFVAFQNALIVANHNQYI